MAVDLCPVQIAPAGIRASIYGLGAFRCCFLQSVMESSLISSGPVELEAKNDKHEKQSH